jgi:hypothetical protein
MMRIEYGRDADHNPIFIEPDDELSFKDFTNRSLKSFGAPRLSGAVIYASCFSQEKPDSEIFPNGMAGATFYNCNLDNCVIPAGNAVIGGSRRRFAVQNDLREWLVDDDGNPTTLLNEQYWADQGYFTDPARIPAEPIASLDEIKPIPVTIDLTRMPDAISVSKDTMIQFKAIVEKPQSPDTTVRELTEFVADALGQAARPPDAAGG